MKASTCPPCNHCCSQGDACPIRQACELPEEPQPLRFHLGLRTLTLHARRAWWTWALANMGPLHPDAPEAVHAIADIDRELAAGSPQQLNSNAQRKEHPCLPY